ncbi:Golgi-associated plant pathogenesis-related protein 1-like [Drosophila ficusphila]|uniref:Golgi-associated plant pathogenesis-related protein 1-like n=1 Tax=Drosophila ficusphila TaxID=30025 RepID=UPI0007E6544A|nr:Golgi-associated plant pathogenesis-related protein 1-like [Drosophila ficusphila]
MDNARIVLRDTNRKRRHHGVPPLTLDLNLSEDCEIYARKLAKSHNYTYSDTTNSAYTENICKYEVKVGRLSRCVQNWYHGREYDFADPRARTFTAMIWRSSKYMGHGDAQISPSTGIMVVRYTPPGNVAGLYTDNVPPRKNKHKKKKSKNELGTENLFRNCATRLDHRSSMVFSIFLWILVKKTLDNVF